MEEEAEIAELAATATATTFAAALRITSPPKIPILKKEGVTEFSVLSITTCSSSPGNCCARRSPGSNTNTYVAVTMVEDATAIGRSTSAASRPESAKMTSPRPSPSLFPRRSPYMALPAAAAGAAATRPTATPFLRPSTSSWPFVTTTPASTPPRPKASAAAPPGAPQKSMTNRNNENFYYDRYAKKEESNKQMADVSPPAKRISHELLAVAEQELMGVNTTGHRRRDSPHPASLEVFAWFAAVAEEGPATTSRNGGNTAGGGAASETGPQNQQPGQSMDMLTATTEATTPSSDERPPPVGLKDDTSKPPPIAIGNMSPGQVLSAIPALVKSRFREVGFAMWGKKKLYYPIIELSPYDEVPFDGAKEMWLAKFEKFQKGTGLMHRLVYWYGFDTFSLLPSSKVVDFDAGLRSNYHLIPKDVLCKIDQGRDLTQDEDTLVRGLIDIEKEQMLKPMHRVKWLLEESLWTKKRSDAATTAASDVPTSAKHPRSGKPVKKRRKHRHFRVGQKILKKFPGYDKPFQGEITLLPTKGFDYYHVLYKDGDGEDIHIDDVSKHVAMYWVNDTITTKKDAQFKVGQAVQKQFPGHGIYRGKITKLPTIGKDFYHVKYEDNDVEDIAARRPIVAAKTSSNRKEVTNKFNTAKATRRVKSKITGKSKPTFV